MRRFRTPRISLGEVGLFAAILLAAAGCSSTLGAEERKSVVVVEGASAWMREEQVRSFRKRFEAHFTNGRPACCAALVRDYPDQAMALYLRYGMNAADEREPVRLGLARAWKAAFGETALTESEERRHAQPELYEKAIASLFGADKNPENAKHAKELFYRLADPFWIDEATYRIASAQMRRKGDLPDLSWTTPSAPTRLQQSKRGVLALQKTALGKDAQSLKTAFRAAARTIMGAGSLALALDIEQLRRRGSQLIVLSREKEMRWLRYVAQAALRQGQPLVALRYSLALGKAGQGQFGRRERLEDQLLLSKAYLASNRPRNALDVAMVVEEQADKMGDRALRARAMAGAGEALFALKRWNQASDFHLRAAELWKGGQRTEGWARQILNAAQAKLRAGDRRESGIIIQRISEVKGLSPSLKRRVMISQALQKWVNGQAREAFPPIERALRDAQEEGDYVFVEQYTELLNRLSKFRSKS